MKSQALLRTRIMPRNGDQREIVVALPRQCESADSLNHPPHGEHCASQGATLPQEVAPVTLRLVHGAPAAGTILNLPVPNLSRLRQLFDLTNAEARLAQRLACGDSVEEAAEKLNVKMTTARTQLAAIFAKTDTRRQAKLVAILSHIAHTG